MCIRDSPTFFDYTGDCRSWSRDNRQVYMISDRSDSWIGTYTQNRVALSVHWIDESTVRFEVFHQGATDAAGSLRCANHCNRFWSKHRVQCRAAIPEEIALSLSFRGASTHIGNKLIQVPQLCSWGRFAVRESLLRPPSRVRWERIELAGLSRAGQRTNSSKSWALTESSSFFPRFCLIRRESGSEEALILSQSSPTTTFRRYLTYGYKSHIRISVFPPGNTLPLFRYHPSRTRRIVCAIATILPSALCQHLQPQFSLSLVMSLGSTSTSELNVIVEYHSRTVGFLFVRNC